MPAYGIFAKLSRIALGACLFTALAGATAAAQEITIGQVGPFTVIPVPDGFEVNQGIQAFVQQANKAGGVRGRGFGFFELDDRYSADGFAEQFAKAMDRKPLALLSPIGSAALLTMLKGNLLDKNDVVILGAIPGAEEFRNPGHPRLFHIRAGDKQQIEKIVTHARTVGVSRMSVLYQDLPIGTSGWAVAEATAKSAPGLDIQGVKSAPEAAPLAAAAQRIKELDSQSVLVL